MNAITKQVHQCDNRYLDTSEIQAITQYAQSLELRLEAMREMEKVEKGVVQVYVKHVKKHYPSFHKYHDLAWEKTARDAALVGRVVAQAIVLDDKDFLNEKLLYWFRTVCMGFGLTPKFVRDVFTGLRSAYEKLLGEESFELARPFLDQVIEVLSDFPEPAVARI